MSCVESVFASVEDQCELTRLQAIEREFDPASRRRLYAAGLTTGWRCLEIGPAVYYATVAVTGYKKVE